MKIKLIIYEEQFDSAASRMMSGDTEIASVTTHVSLVEKCGTCGHIKHRVMPEAKLLHEALKLAVNTLFEKPL